MGHGEAASGTQGARGALGINVSSYRARSPPLRWCARAHACMVSETKSGRNGGVDRWTRNLIEPGGCVRMTAHPGPAGDPAQSSARRGVTRPFALGAYSLSRPTEAAAERASETRLEHRRLRLVLNQNHLSCAQPTCAPPGQRLLLSPIRLLFYLSERNQDKLAAEIYGLVPASSSVRPGDRFGSAYRGQGDSVPSPHGFDSTSP